MHKIVMKNLISQQWEVLSQQYSDLRVTLQQTPDNGDYASRVAILSRTPLKIFKIYIMPELILCSRFFWTKKRYRKYVDYHLQAALEIVKELNKPGSLILQDLIQYHLKHKDDKEVDVEDYASRNSHMRHHLKYIIPDSPIKRELVSDYAATMLKKEV